MTTNANVAAGLALALLGATGALSAQGETEEFRETYEAQAVAMGTSNPPVIPRGRSVVLQLNVTRWSTNDERNELFAELDENGQEGLVKALRKQEEAGWIRATRGGGAGSFPREIVRYAREIPLENGGKRIVMALDRYVSMREGVQQPRWGDYDVTLVVMDVDAEGRGEGQLAMGVRLSLDHEAKQLVIENFGTEPVRLNQVRRR